MITLILRAAGHAPELPHRQRAQRGRHERGARRRASGSSSRPTRATAPSSSCRLEAAIVTNVDHDHLWLLGRHRPMVGRVRRRSSTRSRARRSLCADDPVPAVDRGDRAPDVVTYGWSDDAATGSSTTRRAGRLPLRARPATASSSARSRLPVIGSPQRAERGRRGRDDDGARGRLRRGARALGAFGGVARRFQHRGEVDGVTIVDDYAPPRPRRSPGDPRRARGRLAAASSSVFQPFRYAAPGVMWREFADAFVGADQVVLTDVCGFHEHPIPGVTGQLARCTRCSTRTPTSRRLLPAPDRARRARPAATSARAT